MLCIPFYWLIPRRCNRQEQYWKEKDSFSKALLKTVSVSFLLKRNMDSRVWVFRCNQGQARNTGICSRHRGHPKGSSHPTGCRIGWHVAAFCVVGMWLPFAVDRRAEVEDRPPFSLPLCSWELVLRQSLCQPQSLRDYDSQNRHRPTHLSM